MRISNKSIDRIYVERFVRDRSFRMPEYHLHPYFELYYVEKGTVRVFMNGTMYDLTQGDLLIIPPEELHYMRYYGASPCRRTNVFFREEDLEEDKIKEALTFDPVFRKIQIYRIPNEEREELENLLQYMLREEVSRDGYTELLQQVRLKELILLVTRYGESLDSIAEELHTSDAGILAAAGYISEHYAEKISLQEIAVHAGFSPNYLSTRFRDMTGLGVHDYLTFVRMRHAVRQLLTTNRSITDIALDTGFSSSNYFKDAFKKMYQMTPREYRKKNGNRSGSR